MRGGAGVLHMEYSVPHVHQLGFTVLYSRRCRQVLGHDSNEQHRRYRVIEVSWQHIVSIRPQTEAKIENGNILKSCLSIEFDIPICDQYQDPDLEIQIKT
jgi:hypothetical protein